MDIEALYRQFLNSRLEPKEQKKALMALGISEDLLDQALEYYYEKTGRIRNLRHPDMLVDKKDRENAWYPGGDEMPGSKFWPVLKRYLSETKGWPPETVQSLSQASDKIVSWLDSPWAARVDTRGLVVGYVQSGKTANFTAVIAKAADAGYRFFIVLSGTKKSLRQQTQQRLERELVNLNDAYWFTPTQNHDFRPMGNVNFFLSDEKHDKVLCVVKKNTSVLKKLYKWLEGAAPDVLRKCPFLIIDDEADEASVNTARYQRDAPGALRERTTINRRIVNLLDLLPKAAYVGYTATPFANVFIDPNYDPGLYPKDFIVALPKPEQHFGTERIFGRERLLDEEDREFQGLDMIRLVPQEEVADLKPKRNDHSFVPQITESLENALAYFWMACAARIVRGQGDQHMTMMIHTTQLVQVHENTSQQIEQHRQWLFNLLSGPNGLDYAEKLRQMWESEQAAVPATAFGLAPIDFDKIAPYIVPVIKGTLIVTDNFRSMSRLSYDGDPKIQIAIGGNTLSRGLTLEGLLVSYFVRAAGAYDTLLQMGRWFGYRPGYADLPRIWMTSQLERHFRDLATIEEEIRQDIAVYQREDKTPREFGIRIRTHPDLNITAPLKMQFATPASVSFDDTVQQTVLFNHNDPNWLVNNLQATDTLIVRLERDGYTAAEHNGHVAFFDVGSQYLVDFLRSYNFHENNRALQSNNIIGYVESQLNYDLLTHWNVIIRGIRGQQGRRDIQLGSASYPLLVRSRRKYQDDHAHIGVLMSRGDIGADIRNVEPKVYQNWEAEQLRTERLREHPGRGLLLIYPIDKESQAKLGSKLKTDLEAVEDVIGLGFVFPPAQKGSRGEQTYQTVDLSAIDTDEFEVDEEDNENA